MALLEDFERSGNWLFRWRSYLPISMIGLVLVTMRGFQYPHHSAFQDDLCEVLCLAVCFLGLGVRVLTVGFAPRGTSGRNTEKQEAEVLNTTGLYSVTRNPLYLGNFLIYLGIVLFVHDVWFTIVYGLVFWLYYERIIFAEEAYLRESFGREFTDWAAATPVFFPRSLRFRKPALPFSFRTVLRREYNGFFAIVVVMFFLEVVGESVAGGKLDWWWYAILGIGLATWLVLRYLKKHTRVLELDGR